MSQKHRRRSSSHPYIDTVWESLALTDGTYLVTPDESWDLISATKDDGSHIVFITGQATQPSRLPYKAGERSVVISFAANAYLPQFHGAPFTDNFIMLSMPDKSHFELAGHTFPLPTFNNAEKLIAAMVEQGVLASDEVVYGVLKDAPKAASDRSVQRHFKDTTGLSHKKLADIHRAKQAVRMLKDGKGLTQTAVDAGYYDQPHLTKDLKRLMDSLPSDVDDVNQV